jgi:hypothetical protein
MAEGGDSNTGQLGGFENSSSFLNLYSDVIDLQFDHLGLHILMVLVMVIVMILMINFLLSPSPDTITISLFNGSKLTRLNTRPAPNALFQVNGRWCLFFPSDRIHRAFLFAESTHLTLFRIHPELNQIHTDQSRASLVLNMSFIFISEISNCGEDRVWSSFSQTAVGGLFNMMPQEFQPFDILHFPFTLDDSIQDIEHHLHPHPAGNAFATGFIDRKVREEPGCIDHAGGVVHHDQTTGAHHSSCFIKGVEI